MARVDFPEPALAWLTDGCRGSVLAVAAARGVPRLLAQAGLDVVVLAQDTKRSAGTMLNPHLTTVVARPEALPFGSCHFGLVLVHQMLDRLAPDQALPELARVLRPDGLIASSYFCRDDSVPWVRRLVTLVRTVDEQAMPGEARAAALEPLRASKYFTRQEARDFRIWVPITRQDMLDMVAEQEAIAALSQDKRAELLAEVGTIYDGASRASELRLPYQLRCWRAHVDQAELSRPIRPQPDGLIISQ